MAEDRVASRPAGGTNATGAARTPRRRSLARRGAGDFAFHSAGIVTGVVGFTIWVTGVSVSLSIAIFYFGLIAALASFVAFRWFARVERRRAALVLGEPIPERRRDRDGPSSIFGKVRLPPSNTDHRRVLAVLAFLRS